MSYAYNSYEMALMRRALTRGRGSGGLAAQVRAIDELRKMGTPVPLARIRAELELIAATTVETFEASRAAARAMRVLRIIDGRTVEEWPSETPHEPAGPDYWPYGPRGDPDLAGWEDLDQQTRESQHMRDQWRSRVHGLPPWVPGEVRVPDEDLHAD